jgi:hypothetical protein
MSQAVCKDIMDWEAFPEYDLLYCDPPWGERMVKWFNTERRKNTGNSTTYTLSDILNQLGRLASTVKPLVIEYSIGDWTEVVEIMERHGHVFTGHSVHLQSMGRFFTLLKFNLDFEILSNATGFDTVSETVRVVGATTVFDPFAGIGKTAKAVMRTGAEYIGAEVNEARYAKLDRVING